MAEGGGGAPPVEAVRKGVGKGLFAVVVVVVAIVAFVGGLGLGNVLYGGKGGATPATSTVFSVGTNIPFPPFEDYDAANMTYVGFDMDFSAMIASALHRNMSVVNFADFSTLLATVGHGGVDMAASAITSSGSAGAGRNRTMSFSIPYYLANQAALVQTGFWLHCASSVCTANDLKNLTVGVQTGTTSEDWANTYLVPNETAGGSVKTYTGVDTEIAALEAGSLDAVIIDVGPAKSIAASSSGSLRLAGQIITGEQYSFAVALGDPEGILPSINAVISQAMANGTYQAMLTKWGL